jgi:hypothetical protein
MSAGSSSATADSIRRASMAEMFKVLGITERTRIGPGGNIERYYRHTIETRGGVTMTVDVDEKDFNAKAAKPILEKAALNAEGVLNL